MLTVSDSWQRENQTCYEYTILREKGLQPILGAAGVVGGLAESIP